MNPNKSKILKGWLIIMTDKEIEELWDQLDDAPFKDGYLGIGGMYALTEDWYIFKKGTTKDIIQSWLGRHHSKGEGWLVFGYDSPARDKKLEKLWNELTDVTLNENENGELVLAEAWNEFEKGTELEFIWFWFDKRHSKGVGWLMNEYGRGE
jgi:hypothetical protein